ncbi:MAG: histidine kinase dimerization/phospho-acceptor domain-containing protein [Chloroflexota bacterium]
MKRILVIDESEVVRETLALILGREFAVVKRPLAAREIPFVAGREEIDLLILGVTPQLGTEAAALLRFAAQLPFAVLFLVDSKTIARAIDDRVEIGCLTKPFNPYELHEKVGRLLTQRAAFHRPSLPSDAAEPKEFSSYLDFPFLSRSAALLARRFAAARLPLLISGEIGCGQEQVLSEICGLDGMLSSRLFVNAAEVGEEYLSHKRSQIALQSEFSPTATTLVVENLDKCSSAGQSLLLSFLTGVEEAKSGAIRYLATANTDLLEYVYRGDFLDALYYKLATLTLKLPPLRERLDDIPALADWFARGYARKLGLAEPTLSPQAHLRLRNYLWFGNLSEMQTVLARTLAFHSKPRIDSGDLLFDFSPMPQASALEDFAEFAPASGPSAQNQPEPILEIYRGASVSNGSANGRTKSVELNTVIHELAHELKNPMVTIKTFAQLLGDRYQDENFRTRFQEVVGSDIERMDDLLEVMVEFADFAQPRLSTIEFGERLRAVLAELQSECARRQMRFDCRGNGAAGTVRADEAQVGYILKNVLMMALSEARMGSEIEIEVSAGGTLAIRYQRESARMASISQYLNEAKSGVRDGILPLRLLLARVLVERNGGRLAIDPSDSEKEILRLEFPIAEHGNEI